LFFLRNSFHQGADEDCGFRDFRCREAAHEDGDHFGDFAIDRAIVFGFGPPAVRLTFIPFFLHVLEPVAYPLISLLYPFCPLDELLSVIVVGFR
jgi:hypothetical protein